MSETRTEHDLLGTRKIPQSAYYGIHTLRAVENFPITGHQIGSYFELINALAAIKQAAALTNCDLGLLDDTRTKAIVAACEDIRSGAFHDQFVVDVIQGGAGTSTNMNANEVIANRALEHLGHRRGDYSTLHPIDHVNMGQSTNDVYPTALRIASIHGANHLRDAMRILSDSFATKAEEFHDILKMGRTQLQDAVPMTLGQEFTTYAIMIEEDRERLAEAILLINEINLGGTAIGTGIAGHPEFADRARTHLNAITQLDLLTAADLIEATQDCGAFVQVSSVLKRFAIKLSKICNDLRLLSSGPRAGLNEINLPPVQSGSSIMPGKINPVIPEMANQVAFEVIGNDLTVTMAAEGGQLQLNAFEPIIAHSLFKSLTHLSSACQILATRCVSGITANTAHLQSIVANSIGLVTVLNPYIGYEMATMIALEAHKTGRGVIELIRERKLVPEETLERILAPKTLCRIRGPMRHPNRT